MERYLGVDVHRDSCTFSVLSQSGKQVQRQVVETNGQALVGFVRQLPGTLHLCTEESEWSQWLYEVLSPHVAEMAVVWPERRVPAKSDSLDARELADRLRTGRLGRVIYKAPRRYQRLKELGRVYGLLTVDVVRSKNRLKSLVRRRGITCTGGTIYNPKERDRWISQLPVELRSIGELLGVELDCLVELRNEAEEAMVREARSYPISRILQTLPGLGPIRVAQLLPIVITPHRFRTKRQFWSYCGFGVVTRSSADWVRVDGQWTRPRSPLPRGLNRNYNRTLKGIFKGAATTVIVNQKTIRSALPTIGSASRERGPTWPRSPWRANSQPLRWLCGRTRRSTTRSADQRGHHPAPDAQLAASSASAICGPAADSALRFEGKHPTIRWPRGKPPRPSILVMPPRGTE